MRSVKFSVACTAIYQGCLDLPDEVKDGEELEYIRDHLGEVPVEDLEWLEDLSPEEAVTGEDIRYISGKRTNSDSYEDIEHDLYQWKDELDRLLNEENPDADRIAEAEAQIKKLEDALKDMNAEEDKEL